MNREQAQKLLPIIQAFAEGKEIQFSRECNNWVWYTYADEHPDAEPDFFANDIEWRIKPEKKTGWINIYEYGANCSFHFSREAADGSVDSKRIRIACIQITYEEGQGLEGNQS